MIKAFLLLLLTTALNTAFGAEVSNYDTPGSVPAADLLPPAWIQNSPCKIGANANADGLHATYELFNGSAREEITGTQLLANRVRELQAIASLREMNKSAEFGKALLKSGGEKIQSVGAAVKDPVGTVKNLPQGASKFFGRIGNTVKSMGEGNVGATQAVEGALGVHRAKAELALKLGVSPFTSDPVLQAELDKAARAMAAGATLMNFSGLLVGGGVGTAISAVNMNQTFQRALVESSPDELEIKNRATLQSLGASPQNIDRFLDNPAFSPWQKATIVALLGGIGQNPDPVLVQAAQATSPGDAVYFVQMARLFEKHHKDLAPIVRFAEMDSIPYALDRNGSLVVAVGADLILWTPNLETRVNEFLAVKENMPEVRAMLLATDGSISPLALESLVAKGIQATPQALGPVH
jgi:hypothetical protein